MIVPSAVELLSFVEDLINKWGIYIIPIGAFLENSVILGFIFPGTTVIFLSGFVARTTGGDLWVVILLATIGSFLGDNLDYFIGRRVGRVLENKPLFAKPIGVVEPLLKKYGVWAIFAGRFSAWSRAWVALASGITRFKYLFFALASALSAFVWTCIWIIGGYFVGGNRELISLWLTRASLVVWAGLTVLAVYYFRTRLKLILDLVMFLCGKYRRKIKGPFKNG